MFLPIPRDLGEYWDLKFTTGPGSDYVFYIHKSVVCPQSAWFDHHTKVQPPVLQLQSHDGTDRDLLSRMLWYLYFRHYSYSTLYPFEIEGFPKAQQQHYALESDGDDEDIRSGRRSFFEVLFLHVRMFHVARDCNIPGLMKLAIEKCIARANKYAKCGVLHFDNTHELRAAKTLIEDFNLERLLLSEVGDAVEVRMFVAIVLTSAVGKMFRGQTKILQLEARLEDMEKERRRKAKGKKDEESDEVIESRKKIEELEKKLKELELGSSVGEGWEELQMED